ncbi:MAG: helix-turn-helix transcriptional regulator [Gemmatimonadaceae bacterium]
MTPIQLRVKELREAKGISAAALARQAGIRAGTLSAIENNRTTGVDFDVLERLATALDVDPGFLVVKRGAKRGK